MKLSLCLATFKRAEWIGETLDAILPQLGEEVELVVVDGASPDDTEAVVRRHIGDNPHVRYFRETVNSGVDADYDKAVGYARGEYAWLVADDDLLVPGAVERVLRAIVDGPDLVVVDAEVRDVVLQHVLDAKRLSFDGEHRYEPGEGDRLLAETGNALSFIGCTIIRRALWLERDRARYYGSLFVHVGVIFQAPLTRHAKSIPEPLVAIRLGNAMWSARSFEIWMLKWPELIWAFAGLSDAAKAAVVPREPWRLPLRPFLYRANGAFDGASYRCLFKGRRLGVHRLPLRAASLLPGRLCNFLAVVMLTARKQGRGSGAYNLLACSPFATPLSRAVVWMLAKPEWLARAKRG
jgi:hypothetical protein